MNQCAAFYSCNAEGIRPVWITSRSGVPSKRPRSADEGFGFIKAVIRPPNSRCKGRSSRVFQLAQVQMLVLPSPASAQSSAVSARHGLWSVVRSPVVSRVPIPPGLQPGGAVLFLDTPPRLGWSHSVTTQEAHNRLPIAPLIGDKRCYWEPIVCLLCASRVAHAG
jgi:hypothetical protein